MCVTILCDLPFLILHFYLTFLSKSLLRCHFSRTKPTIPAVMCCIKASWCCAVASTLMYYPFVFVVAYSSTRNYEIVHNIELGY
ncbi:hypothetical protein vseg_014314 [Gypsophila vaccaria]